MIILYAYNASCYGKNRRKLYAFAIVFVETFTADNIYAREWVSGRTLCYCFDRVRVALATVVNSLTTRRRMRNDGAKEGCHGWSVH